MTANNKTSDRDRLLQIGFSAVAEWHCIKNVLSYPSTISTGQADAIFSVKNALYAFCSSDAVLYVGKTTRTIKCRFDGYINPGTNQQTNIKCNKNIKALLSKQRPVEILVFTAHHCFQYGEFEINLAAGLEDSLINMLTPPWNGRNRKRLPISETSATEESLLAQPMSRPASRKTMKPLKTTFKIKLGKAYYEMGFINPGRAVDKKLGKHGENLTIFFDDTSTGGIACEINRTANPNKTVRLYGGQVVAKWFQKHFKRKDMVSAVVLSRNKILLMRKAKPKGRTR